MMQAERGNACVVDARAFYSRRLSNNAQLPKISGTFGQHLQWRCREQRIHKAKGLVER